MMINDKWWVRGKILGRGGYGIVCEGRPIPNTHLSRILPAVMAVKSSLNMDSLYCEKSVLSIFNHNHPYIIGYYGYDVSYVTTNDGIDIPLHNIFLEYASDGDLFDKLMKTGGVGLSENEVSEIVKGILLGLKDIHKLGLIHCDIKPDNILMVDGVPKIADFGLTMMRGVIPKERRGTSQYMAPETITHGVYNWWADIWSLGCTILQMLTGQNVWGKFPFTEEMINFVGQYDIVPQIPNGLSLETIDFLQKCLVRDCSKRWSAESLLKHPFVMRPLELGKNKVKKPSYLSVLMKGLNL